MVCCCSCCSSSSLFLLLATPVIAYRNSKKIELEPWTEKRMINFGKSIQDKPVWLLDNPDVPTTALSLGSDSIPNVSSRFGTDPLPVSYTHLTLPTNDLV